ncbi:hypothetical protein AB0K36_24145 [Streptomyces kurssanovii]|uniref:DNA-directed RNA polymerase specialized sigma24 family protein n=1 Tax=Streptomyces kurssanovii TaxID=67312 RepID=A0ABV3HZ49_9ACTN
MGVGQAEAAVVEHYPRLVRIAYLVLPPSLGQGRRVLTAHALVQRSLPRGDTGAVPPLPAVPRARRPEGAGDPGYRYVRDRVLRQALDASRPLRRRALPRRAQFPPLLPHVWGLRVFPRSGGADELALDQWLSALSGPGRAAYVLRHLEKLSDPDVRQVLTAAGAGDPGSALAEADGVADGSRGAELLRSSEFDACSLQVRPTDLMRRRGHTRAAVVAAAALAVCGTLLLLPGGGDGAADVPYTRNPAVEAALDPDRLVRAAPTAWRESARRDFSVWPARGSLSADRVLLRRALTAWSAPGEAVRVTSTPGTPSGPPMGPPQLLFAGEVGAARVVVLHDGLRVVRYAETTRAPGAAGNASLDFARTDGADAAGSSALVAGRSRDSVRYLTAPWVRDVSARDLLDPAGRPRPVRRDANGLTERLPSPVQQRACRSWQGLELAGGGSLTLVTDLGELTPAQLTYGPPGAAEDVTGTAARASWARTACLLPGVRAHGVRSVNSWQYARQRLPEANGTAGWVCTRAETWRGTGSRVMAQFQAPAEHPGAAGTVVARAEDSPACGVREPRVLAGVLWQSRAGQWYVLAAGSSQLASVTVAGGGVEGGSTGHVVAVRSREGSRPELNGLLPDGTPVRPLR